MNKGLLNFDNEKKKPRTMYINMYEWGMKCHLIGKLGNKDKMLLQIKAFNEIYTIWGFYTCAIFWIFKMTGTFFYSTKINAAIICNNILLRKFLLSITCYSIIWYQNHQLCTNDINI